MKKIIKNHKRGVVIEMAILVIFIVAAVSILIITFSSMGTLRTKKMFNQLKENVLVDTVAEDYVDYLINGKVGEFLGAEGFTISETEAQDIITLQFLDNGELKLTVKLEKSFDGVKTSYTVYEWKY